MHSLSFRVRDLFTKGLLFHVGARATLCLFRVVAMHVNYRFTCRVGKANLALW